jgi:hypothetical protein
MLKNIIFALLALVALATSPSILAADTAEVESEYVKALTANNPPENDAKQEAVPQVKNPETPKEAEMQTQQENPVSETSEHPSDIKPNNDKLFDYRYCLDLKTDLEIAKCRYKK